MSPRSLLAALTLIVIASSTWLGPAAAIGQPAQWQVEAPVRYRMDNGLQVILAPDRRLAQVALVVSYHAGSCDEPAGYEGLAHLVQHLSGRSTRHAPAGLQNALDSVQGGEFEARTDCERTFYASDAPASRLPQLLWLESERMGFALQGFAASNVADECSALANESSLELLSTQATPVRDAAIRALVPRDPRYRQPGAPMRPRDLEVEHARWFYQRWYRPDNATLVLVGGFEADAARELVERFFGPIHARGARAGRRMRTPIELGGQAIWRGRGSALNHPRIQMFWSLPAPTLQDELALQALARWLAAHDRAALPVALGPTVTHVAIAMHRYDPQLLLELRFEVAVGVPLEPALHAIDSELNKLRKRALEPERFLPARQGLAAEFAASVQTARDRAHELARWSAAHPDVADVMRERIERTLALDAGQLQAALREFLPLDRRLLILTPAGSIYDYPYVVTPQSGDLSIRSIGAN